MINPYQSVYFSGLGANSVFIGYLLGVNSAVTALMQLVGGYVADAWGRRRVVVIFSFLSAGTAFVFIFMSEPALLMIPIVIGAISGIYGPAFNATLTDSMEPDLKGKRPSFLHAHHILALDFLPICWRNADANFWNTRGAANCLFLQWTLRRHWGLI